MGEAGFPPACRRAGLRKDWDMTCLLSSRAVPCSRSSMLWFPGEEYSAVAIVQWEEKRV